MRGLTGATILAGLMAWAIGAAPVLAQPAATGVGSQFELVFWQSVAASEDVGQLEAYLSRYPDGTFAAIARAKIQRLRPPAPGAGANPAPAAGQPYAATPPTGPVATPIATAAIAATVAAPPAGSAAAAAPGTAGPRIVPPAPAAPVAAPPAVIVAAPAAPVVVPAPAPALPPAAAQGAAAAPPPAPAPAPAQPAAPAPVSLADQLAALAQSQGQAAGLGTTGSDHSRILPAAPDLPAPDPVVLPARFCSAVERNAFYDERFTPSKDAADENNRRAIAHLQALQALYDRLGQQGDPDGQNAVSTASKAYQATAAAAYQVSAGYDGLFRQMMAVPIADCAPPPAKGKGQ